jgi:hypothetical protein
MSETVLEKNLSKTWVKNQKKDIVACVIDV